MGGGACGGARNPPAGPADPLWTYKLVTLFLLAHYQGDRATMRALLRAELPDGPATAPGALYYIRSLRLLPLAADLALDEGDPTEARAWLECHDRLLAASGGVRGLAAGQLGWAAYHRATGDPVRARAHGERALVHAIEPRQPLDLLAAHRLLGELAAAEGQHADAAAHLDAALALADACAAPYERALTLLARAELLAAARVTNGANAALAEARAILAPLGAAPALARADALAATLHAASRPTGLPDGLSRREAEVLRLLAAGRSNHEIAAALHLSPRTAQRHVANAYLKIGAHNRAEATAYALRHRLA